MNVLNCCISLFLELQMKTVYCIVWNQHLHGSKNVWMRWVSVIKKQAAWRATVWIIQEWKPLLALQDDSFTKCFQLSRLWRSWDVVYFHCWFACIRQCRFDQTSSEKENKILSQLRFVSHLQKNAVIIFILLIYKYFLGRTLSCGAKWRKNNNSREKESLYSIDYTSVY